MASASTARATACAWPASPACRPSTAASPTINICSSTAPGEGPAAGRRGARRLSRPARPRPPSGRRPVPRPPARRGRRQRPPGQDRGPLPRSVGGPRPDRRRPAPRARRRQPAQRRPRAGRGAGDVDQQRELRRSARRIPANRMRLSGSAVRDRLSRDANERRSSSLFDHAPARPRRAGHRRPCRSYPARRRPRPGRRHLYRRRGRGRPGPRRPACRARAAGARTHARGARAAARSPRQALLLPEVVELDEPACDRLEGARRRARRNGPRARALRPARDARPRDARRARQGRRQRRSLTDLADELAALGGAAQPAATSSTMSPRPWPATARSAPAACCRSPR